MIFAFAHLLYTHWRVCIQCPYPLLTVLADYAMHIYRLALGFCGNISRKIIGRLG
jgi:hypothetical protein